MPRAAAPLLALALLLVAPPWPRARAATCQVFEEEGADGALAPAGPFTQARCGDPARGGGARWTLRPDLEALPCALPTSCAVAECCRRNSEEEEAHHRSLSVAATGLCLAFVAAVMMNDAVEKYGLSDVAPSSTCMILTGIVLGIVGLADEPMREFMEFDPEVFGFFLLPVIIFSSSYNIGQGGMHVFFVQIGRIVFFAVFGTLIAITFTGGVILAGDAIIGFLPTESFPGVCSASITAATEEECRQADGGATAIWTPHADMQTNVSPATVAPAILQRGR